MVEAAIKMEISEYINNAHVM